MSNEQTKPEFSTGDWKAKDRPFEQASRAIAAYYGGEAWKDKDGSFWREAEANANLLAASRDLYEALRDASDWLADDCEPDGGIDPDLANLRRTILAALSKARGET